MGRHYKLPRLHLSRAEKEKLEQQKKLGKLSEEERRVFQILYEHSVAVLEAAGKGLNIDELEFVRRILGT